jgi:hypothetical protein
MMNWKGCGTGRGLTLRHFLTFAWKDYGKPRKTSVRIAGHMAEI